MLEVRGSLVLKIILISGHASFTNGIWNEVKLEKSLKIAEIFVLEKIRQIEGRSALLSKNVNKLWQIFLSFKIWDIFGDFSTLCNLYIAWVGVSFVAKRKILQPQSSRWNFNNSAVRSRMSCRSSLSFLCYDAKMLSRMKLC